MPQRLGRQVSDLRSNGLVSEAIPGGGIANDLASLDVKNVIAHDAALGTRGESTVAHVLAVVSVGAHASKALLHFLTIDVVPRLDTTFGLRAIHGHREKERMDVQGVYRNADPSVQVLLTYRRASADGANDDRCGSDRTEDRLHFPSLFHV